MEDKLIFQDDEVALLKKRDVEDYLEYCLKEQEKNDDGYNNRKEYYAEQKDDVLRDIENLQDDDLVCLYDNPMSGWYMVEQSMIKDIMGGE